MFDHAFQPVKLGPPDGGKTEVPAHLSGAVVDLDDDAPAALLQSPDARMEAVTDVIEFEIRTQDRVQRGQARIDEQKVRVERTRIFIIGGCLDPAVHEVIVLAQHGEHPIVGLAIEQLRITVDGGQDGAPFGSRKAGTMIRRELPHRRAGGVHHVLQTDGLEFGERVAVANRVDRRRMKEASQHPARVGIGSVLILVPANTHADDVEPG